MRVHPMVEREKLEKLARVMGGRFITIPHNKGPLEAAEWGPFRAFRVWENGTYEPGTLESLEEKVREWVDEGDARYSQFNYFNNERCEMILFSWDHVDHFPGSTKLSTLIDAVLWISEQESP